MDATLAIQIAAPLIAVGIWLLRLEGRVNGHDRDHTEHLRRHNELRDDVTYIRDRIDRALNGK